jgi:hypothetical protein
LLRITNNIAFALNNSINAPEVVTLPILNMGNVPFTRNDAVNSYFNAQQMKADSNGVIVELPTDPISLIHCMKPHHNYTVISALGPSLIHTAIVASKYMLIDAAFDAFEENPSPIQKQKIMDLCPDDDPRFSDPRFAAVVPSKDHGFLMVKLKVVNWRKNLPHQFWSNAFLPLAFSVRERFFQ